MVLGLISCEAVRKQGVRGNIEVGSNLVDLMTIHPSRRDYFPKMDLHHGHLGDGYPLCTAMPPRAFLRRGAKYRYLSSGNTSDLQTDPNFVNGCYPAGSAGCDTMRLPRLHLRRSASSALYRKLCWPHANFTDDLATASCTYASEVVLDAEIPCDGVECSVDKPRTIGIVDADGTVLYYEYVPAACTHLAFFNHGRYAQRNIRTRTRWFCLDQNATQAAAVCCNNATPNAPTASCGFVGELVTYSTAESRCHASSSHLCPHTRRYLHPGSNPINASQTFTSTCGLQGHEAAFPTWANIPCSIDIQVGSDGKIGMIHSHDNETGWGLWGGSSPYSAEWQYQNYVLLAYPPMSGYTIPELQANARSSFRVRWRDGSFPTAATNCSSGVGCRVDGETCICATETVTEAVFVDSAAPPNKTAILAQLTIGSAPPETFDDGEYTQCTTAACLMVSSEVAIFTRRSGAFDEDTIFRISVNESARVLHFGNVRSTVRLRGAPQFEFRNPPMFMVVHDLAERDAQYETEAVIDHLFYHKNVAPFIATRLIQRLTTSNPSPRYVRAVTSAFKTGAYDRITYSGRYGDLAATVAAIVLDREATSPILDADPSHGGVREPLIKLFHLMRSMEYVSEDGREVEINTKCATTNRTHAGPLPTAVTLWLTRLHVAFDLSFGSSVGQSVYESPTVFSFFLPEYMPSGAAYEAQLLSPEAQVATAPNLINFLNGATSLIRNGLVSCEGGFGARNQCPSGEANLPRADGYLTWQPKTRSAAETIEGLDLLLTAGRLEEHTKRVLTMAYNDTLVTTGSHERAMKLALEVLMATAEFGTTSDNPQRSKPRTPMPEVPFQSRPYKALVFLYLSGGVDSFNMLVPHSNCANESGANDLYAEYSATRAIAKVGKNQLLTIDASGSNQTCQTFGLHPALSFVRSQYTAGEAAFIANVGALVEPTTRAMIEAKTARLPLSLFAHNVQTTAAFTVHAQKKVARAGIIGNILNVLERDSGMRTSSWSINGNRKILDGARPPWVLHYGSGFVRWQRRDHSGFYMRELHTNESGSPFGETIADKLTSTIAGQREMSDLLNAATLSTSFSNVMLELELQQVSKVIKTRDARQAERDIFFVSIGGWDMHNEVVEALQTKLEMVDSALRKFVSEMRAQGIWDSVVIQQSSEFGRNLASNARGTDHGWGGNVFVMGGRINGSRIHGVYPDSMKGNSRHTLRGGQGRVIPTMGWEGVWKPLAQWLGVADERMSEIMPNHDLFPDEQLLTQAQVFGAGS